jgi:hypothetical protein
MGGLRRRSAALSPPLRSLATPASRRRARVARQVTWSRRVSFASLMAPLAPLGALALLVATVVGNPAAPARPQHTPHDPFRQLEELLPTPTDTRTASGAPGPGYWQQRADYAIDVTLDDANQRIIGSEQITYTNNSPDELRYLWMQLDANIFAPDADAATTAPAPDLAAGVGFEFLASTLERERFDGSFRITRVADKRGKPLRHTVVKTMMRIDLPEPLPPGRSYVFEVDWNYAINDQRKFGGRAGYEHFPDDGNYLYELAQWFPRMAAYIDVTGWQHKQYLGRGEFTLEFGDYDVRITVPEDHVVAATGELRNAKKVLTKEQQRRLDAARRSDKPLFVITPEEAKANEGSRAKATKTWEFRAKDVRDFAWASSRKFIWDAQGYREGGTDTFAMSYYPKEAEPLWSRYSTRAIVHTLDVYSRYTFDYPYPVAISVNGPVGGMEYPMICFNGPRPEKDGTYSKRTKYGLISVIIHEVGHNYFPMIVNSDERQWTWMDEGLNSFLQFLAEQEWEQGYPSRRGEPREMVDYMRSTAQMPIMTNSESIIQFGNNAYGKPATALNVLRETVLGRELFDFAFKEYARRWKFKRPMPADLFRTMEDASGIDLDWFWRGWFYTTAHTDIALADLRLFEVDTEEPAVEKAFRRRQRDAAQPPSQSSTRNAGIRTLVDELPELKDFYNDYDELAVTPKDDEAYRALLDGLDDGQRALLRTTKRFYLVDLVNEGGLVMPVILAVTFADGSTQEVRVPAEIWRSNPDRVSKLLIVDKPIQAIVLDPKLETADTDLSDNAWPRQVVPSRFKLFKRQEQSNPMRDAQPAPSTAAEPASPPAKPEGSRG